MLNGLVLNHHNQFIFVIIKFDREALFFNFKNSKFLRISKRQQFQTKKYTQKCNLRWPLGFKIEKVEQSVNFWDEASYRWS